MPCTLTKEQINNSVAFHGHWCPGLAYGLRASEWVLNELCKRSLDEELVAVVETDMCAVDAIQFLTGCTFGKGNLIHKDYGKNAFTFHRRQDGKAARLVIRARQDEDWQTMRRLHQKYQTEALTAEETSQLAALKDQAADAIMEDDIETIFEIQPVKTAIPQRARILNSIICDHCREAVMETRIRQYQTKNLCIPCFERIA